MSDDIKLIESLYSNDYDSTPERRLWIAVLTSLIDDIMYYTRTRNKSDKRRKWMQEKTILEQDDWTEKEITRLYKEASSQHIKGICLQIDVCHNWFMRNVEHLVKNKSTARPNDARTKKYSSVKY